MLASLLPGLRHMRAPLTAGGIWLAIMWLYGARFLPGSKNATGFLKDVYELTAYLGKPATLGILGLTAYLIGEIWASTRRSVMRTRRRAMIRMAHEFGVRNPLTLFFWLISPWLRFNPSLRLVRLFTTDTGAMNDLLPKRGIKRPNINALAWNQARDLHEATFDDMQRARTTLLDTAPELRAEHDRHLAESEFRDIIALPAAMLTFGFVYFGLDDMIGVSAYGVAIGIVPLIIAGLIYVGIHHNAAIADFDAWRQILEAIYLERVPSPSLTRVGMDLFGPVDPKETGGETSQSASETDAVPPIQYRPQSDHTDS